MEAVYSNNNGRSIALESYDCFRALIAFARGIAKVYITYKSRRQPYTGAVRAIIAFIGDISKNLTGNNRLKRSE